jgi:hypothetical protein
VLQVTGPQVFSATVMRGWPQGSAFVHNVEGVDVLEGLPNREYTVVSLIDVYDDKPFYHDSTTRDRVIALSREHGADAIVRLSDRTVSSGYLKMMHNEVNPASVDTGRSSQPEVVITNVTRDTAMSYKKVLRSSLLLVKWK